MRTTRKLVLLLTLLALLVACGSAPTPAATPTPPAPTVAPSPTISSLSYEAIQRSLRQIYADEGYPKPTPCEYEMECRAADTNLQQRLGSYINSITGTRIDWQGWPMGVQQIKSPPFTINGYMMEVRMSPDPNGAYSRDVTIYFEEPDEQQIKALTGFKGGQSVEFRGVIESVSWSDGVVAIFDTVIVAVK